MPALAEPRDLKIPQDLKEIREGEKSDLNWISTLNSFIRISGVARGGAAMGAVGSAAPVAQIVRGQHKGKELPFLQELYFKTSVLLT